MNASIPPPPPAITPTPPVPPAASASATPPPPPSSTHSPSPQPLAAKVPGKKRKRSSYDNKELKKSVTLCDDGKYRWIYELSMWKNPTLLILIYKVLGIAFGIVGLFILILNWENLSFAWEDVCPYSPSSASLPCSPFSPTPSWLVCMVANTSSSSPWTNVASTTSRYPNRQPRHGH